MSTVTYGADADELDRLAGEFRATADELDSQAGALSGFLNGISWLGDVAIRFTNNWAGTSIPQIGLSTRFLREAADRLATNAVEQRRASGDAGHRPGGLADFIKRFAELARQLAGEAARMEAIAAALGDALERVDDLPADEQAAWWNGLTPDQQEALIARRPEELLGLGGLPEDARQRAEDSFLAAIADEVVTSDSSLKTSVEFSVKIFKVGGEVEVEQTVYADGSVAVTLGAGIAGGVGVGKLAKAMVEAGIDGTYKFANQEEADRFLAGLLRAAGPENVGDVVNFTNEAVKDVVSYLAGQHDHLETYGVEAGVSGSAELKAPSGEGGAEFEVGGSVRVERNRVDETLTYSANGHVSGGVDLGGVKVDGSIDGSVGVTVSDGRATELNIDLDYEGGLSLVDDLGLELESGSHAGGKLSVSFDLTDPDVRSALGPALNAALRGDVDAVLAQVAGNVDEARVTVQSTAGTQFKTGFDAGVVKAEMSGHTNVTTSTYVKPPRGNFIEFRN